ncbi:DUF2934 domain-containing protein [Devosia sediminis]|uniref:DUF2934 domain-containing protein n=1 Tax=Devosia sediminis TaxID=2798801 RepID=A0A934MKL8_9HYPH|nr:DUF2934 domain-containing protein [Devosia sediminis]MBJ3784260.1 DUF2934 domain-containing protein [Devosia sediminis]
MHEDIQRRAYALWEADGRPHGQDQSYWFRAVHEITTEAAKAIKPPRKRTARVRKAA